MYIYTNMAAVPCPCPVLTAAIAYSATVSAANHGASVLQIESLFRVDDMILEISKVHEDHVDATVISPALRMGQIVQYNREFVEERVHDYIRLM